jgi:endonuclease YncB( thermonuclease family)
MIKRWWGVLCCAVALSASAQTLQGTVTRVVDGDSLWVTPAAAGAEAVEVRLLGIDAPEICQAHGPEARDALRELVQGRAVSLKGVGRDTYGRLLATITLEGLDVNRRMVAEGHAWSSRHKWDQGPYVKQERQAKALSRGLHAAGGAVMPREFRQSHGPCNGETSVAAPAPPTTRPATPATPAVQAATYRCDGRTRCSQMRSCDEAKFFLQHCPGVQMDGNRDGVPCESQWCR